ncbi:MAG: dTMP kinase [Pseudomonadales bacterium]|jgi:dTMP kinase
MRGKMISVEGIEGVGKSTLLPLMAETLRQSGITVVETREPGGTVIGEQIRNVLLHQKEAAIAPVTELTMMFAARAQHLEEVIKPALHSGHWVLCDRFTDSTYAYQGGGRKLPSSLIEKIEHAVIESFQPDHTLLLDLDVIEGLNRAAQTGAKDRFESESIAFFNRVREAYLSRASQFDRITVLSAAPPLMEVSRTVVTWIADIRGHAVDE